jgi:hypothetical protein
MQWEYFIREGDLDIHALNYLGKEGWELVNVSQYQTIGQVGQNLLQFSLVFKRPLKERREESAAAVVGSGQTTLDRKAAGALANFDKTFGKDGAWME